MHQIFEQKNGHVLGYFSLILATLSSELHASPSWHVGKPANVFVDCPLSSLFSQTKLVHPHKPPRAIYKMMNNLGCACIQVAGGCFPCLIGVLIFFLLVAVFAPSPMLNFGIRGVNWACMITTLSKAFLSKATPFQRNPSFLILVVRLCWACSHFTAHTIIQLFAKLLHINLPQVGWNGGRIIFIIVRSWLVMLLQSRCISLLLSQAASPLQSPILWYLWGYPILGIREPWRYPIPEWYDLHTNSIIPWYGHHIPFHLIPYHTTPFHLLPYHTFFFFFFKSIL